MTDSKAVSWFFQENRINPKVLIFCDKAHQYFTTYNRGKEILATEVLPALTKHWQIVLNLSSLFFLSKQDIEFAMALKMPKQG